MYIIRNDTRETIMFIIRNVKRETVIRNVTRENANVHQKRYKAKWKCSSSETLQERQT